MPEFGNYGSKEEMEAAFAATGAFNDKLRADGYWVAGGLQPASTATVVDGRQDSPVLTDGPYLETKEVLGVFWVIDAPDLDVALRLVADGSRLPGKGRGPTVPGSRLSRPIDDQPVPAKKARRSGASSAE